MQLMKKWVSLLLVCIMLCMAVPMMAGAAQRSYQDVIVQAMEYYRQTFRHDYEADPDDPDFVPAKADLWEYVCAYQYGVTENADYAFMIPDFSADALTDASTPADCAKTLLGLLLTGDEEQAAVAADHLASLQAEDGSFTGTVQDVTGYSWAVVALLAAQKQGITVDFDLEKAITAITAQAKEDGGYNDYGDTGSVDTTGMVMVGLAAAGTQAAQDALADAAAFIKSTRQADGYFVGKGMYDSANSCSQAYGLIGLICADDMLTESEWSASVDALLRCQDENGGFWYQETKTENGWSTGPDTMSTYQAIMALYDVQNEENFFVNLVQNGIPDKTESDETLSSQSNSSEETSATNDISNPKTGEQGINIIVWILLGIALVALVVILLIPVLKKNKKDDNTLGDVNGDDSNHNDIDNDHNHDNDNK